jgi:hypothetical protein
MTIAAETCDEGEPAPSPARLISVVDAVCCVYFTAAGKSALLISILAELGMEILIPAEVEREVLRKRAGQVQVQWRRLRSSQRVKILEELTPLDSRADVVATVARVRGTSAQLALAMSRDLGEAVVIGHAMYSPMPATRSTSSSMTKAARFSRVAKDSPSSRSRTFSSPRWTSGCLPQRNCERRTRT